MILTMFYLMSQFSRTIYRIDLKIGPELGWEYLVKKLAKTLVNFWFYENFKVAPFFWATLYTGSDEVMIVYKYVYYLIYIRLHCG